MNVDKRIALEKRIAGQVITDALAAGYMISVWEGGDWAIKRSTNKAAIVEAMMSTDSDNLVLRKADGTRVGSILFVYGNDGWDVIADYSDNAEIAAVIARANVTADKAAA